MCLTGYLLFGRVLAAYVVLLSGVGFVSACLPCVVQVSTESVEFEQLVRVHSQLGSVYVFWWCHKGMVVVYLQGIHLLRENLVASF